MCSFGRKRLRAGKCICIFRKTNLSALCSVCLCGTLEAFQVVVMHAKRCVHGLHSELDFKLRLATRARTPWSLRPNLEADSHANTLSVDSLNARRPKVRKGGRAQRNLPRWQTPLLHPHCSYRAVQDQLSWASCIATPTSKQCEAPPPCYCKRP